MDYMIYIYAGLAFVLAGGGWFIGFHQGHRKGCREGRERGRTEGFYVGATIPEGASTARIALRMQPLASEYGPRQGPTLNDQIHAHLEIMDADD